MGAIVTRMLNLGVVDVPYVDAETPAASRKRIKAGKPPASNELTTGDVAEILEDRYHVKEVFYELHKQDIADDLAKSVASALETIVMGGPADVDPFGAATSKIDERFSDFLTNREMEQLGYADVPTKAAIDGVNHRKKHPYASKNKRRPSFIDTGLYQASAKSWVE